jgi:integration host factor subunit beta
MTKADLISHVVERTNLTRHITTVIGDTFFDSMKESLIRCEGVEIRGFGSFSVRSYGERTGRNPKSGESIDVPPKKLPFFKVGKELKERVNHKNA